MARMTAIVGAWALLASAALAQTKPVATISFDNDLNAVGPGGARSAFPIGKPDLAAGKVGKALKSGPGTGYVEYATEGILNIAAGTVEMWVCPLDWTPDEEKFHVFFDVRGEGALYLYKYYQGTRLLMLTCGNQAGPYASSSFDVGGWKRGEWHHIAGTWSADGVMSYVDGKPAAKLPASGPLPKALGKTFRIGDHPWHIERATSSLIDEVRIYDRCLSPAHIAAHFEGKYDFTASLQAESALLSCELDPGKWEAQIRLSTGGADVEDACLAAKLAIMAKGAALPADAMSVGFVGGQAIRTMPMISRQPGEYEVVARVSLEGKQAFELRRLLVIPTTEWQ
ncbi:MAG: LamG domain-containing protein, partial [Planctomycetes bacterium]|nr:LamG domain-containing protein [Planctomycetota bacterium]